VLATSVIGMCCLTAFAADEAKKKPDPEKFFQKTDANGDGSLSLEEFKAGMPAKVADKADARFKKVDANGDGKVSLDEFKTGLDKLRKRKKP
jgi:Ca2+-binding EF-hand superfamily protein